MRDGSLTLASGIGRLNPKYNVVTNVMTRSQTHLDVLQCNAMQCDMVLDAVQSMAHMACGVRGGTLISQAAPFGDQSTQ